jgi:hypothetical protein
MARRWPKSVGQWSWGHLAGWGSVLPAQLRTRGWAAVATARDAAGAARLEALAARPGSGLVV